jgi:TonB family protein
MRRFAPLLPLILAACAAPALPGPLPGADPRDRPFIPRSDMPVPPAVNRAADAAGCTGEPLRALSAALPEYPARGWSRGLQGWSIIQFDVENTGAVSNVRIARGVPGGSFDREALRAVRDWRFRPLEREGRLTGCVVLFEFRLGEVRVR